MLYTYTRQTQSSKLPEKNTLFKSDFALVGFAVLLALALRLPDLNSRPMHTDEAVQAAKTGALLERNEYRYNPEEFHGPTLYYFTLPVLWISGTHSFAESREWQYRMVPALFGAVSIALLLLFSDALGTSGICVCALLLAVSPAQVYYGRYYIQEELLVCFTLACAGCAWRWCRSGRPMWAVLCGVAAGLMFATKETCIISFVALGAALFFSQSTQKAQRTSKGWIGRWGLFGGAAVGVALLFYSSFFTHAGGPLDSIRAYGNYFRKGSGGGNSAQPVDYYLRLLLWNFAPGGPLITEAAIVVLAALGGLSVFFRKEGDDVPRLFTILALIYTLLTTVAYSFISYKTPWCVLNLELGSIVLAGRGATFLLEHAAAAKKALLLRGAYMVLLLTAVAHLGWQSYRANYRYAADVRNPYVYAHTAPDAVRQCTQILELARLHPDGEATVVKVMAAGADYWPLPWYLRTLKEAGYWSAPPVDVDAPVIVASAEFAPELKLAARGRYEIHSFGLRPGLLLLLYVDADLWKAYLASAAKRPHQ